jgi:ribosomal subunit interface protein
METPLELSFKNMQHSDFVEGLIREKVAKLERLHDRITSCHVYVEAPHKRHRKGNQYEIRIEVRVPGTELAVNNKPGDVNAHEEINVAIRDAFNAMERQLQRWKQKVSGEVKLHDDALQGRVTEIDHDSGHGQITATDGRLIYFHENSVVAGGFRKLRQDDPVELVVQEDESEIGPQASTVRPISETKFSG